MANEIRATSKLAVNWASRKMGFRTQSELARILDISPVQVYRWCNGITAPGSEVAARIMILMALDDIEGLAVTEIRYIYWDTGTILWKPEFPARVGTVADVHIGETNKIIDFAPEGAWYVTTNPRRYGKVEIDRAALAAGGLEEVRKKAREQIESMRREPGRKTSETGNGTSGDISDKAGEDL